MSERFGRGGRKRVYRVGEVSRLTGLEGHVLRYWETEFPQLDPRKSRGGQRLYGPEDVALVERIKDLLHVQRYTIAGARRRLEAEPEAGDEDLSERLDRARIELRAILTLLEANDTL